MKLTKEECLDALRYITNLYEELYITRLKESGNHIDDTKEYWILEQLINEHFEIRGAYEMYKDIAISQSTDKVFLQMNNNKLEKALDKACEIIASDRAKEYKENLLNEVK